MLHILWTIEPNIGGEIEDNSTIPQRRLRPRSPMLRQRTHQSLRWSTLPLQLWRSAMALLWPPSKRHSEDVAATYIGDTQTTSTSARSPRHLPTTFFFVASDTSWQRRLATSSRSLPTTLWQRSFLLHAQRPDNVVLRRPQDFHLQRCDYVVFCCTRDVLTYYPLTKH